jgi:hypothetical protein
VIARLTRAPRDAALWATVAVLLALAAWPWLAWAVRAPDRLAAATAAPAAIPAPLPPLDAFREIAARPLFTPDRRPPAHAPVRVSQELRLEGVVVIGAEKRAIIKQADGRTARVSEGGTVGDWTVRQIDRDRVLLVAGDRRLELTPHRAAAPH